MKASNFLFVVTLAQTNQLEEEEESLYIDSTKLFISKTPISVFKFRDVDVGDIHMYTYGTFRLK